MADPFRSLVTRDRIVAAIALCLLLGLTVAVSALAVWPPNTEGELINAEVVRLSTYPAPEGMGGDLPILTVRLPDRSMRQITPSWAA